MELERTCRDCGRKWKCHPISECVDSCKSLCLACFYSKYKSKFRGFSTEIPCFIDEDEAVKFAVRL